MQMPLLEVVQKFCLRRGIPSTTAVVSSGDQQIQQIHELCNEVLEDLMEREWEFLKKIAVFTTVASEDQGLVTDLAPEGFLRFINQTFYDRTQRLPVYGPLDAVQWEQLKALPNAGPFYKYRVFGGRLQCLPAAPVGHTWAFEYVSSWLVRAVDNVTYRGQFLADTDTFIGDYRLLLAGLQWKWQAAKGLDYAESFRRYEELVTLGTSTTGSKPILDMSGCSGNFQPGIFVPAGNWNV